MDRRSFLKVIGIAPIAAGFHIIPAPGPLLPEADPVALKAMLYDSNRRELIACTDIAFQPASKGVIRSEHINFIVDAPGTADEILIYQQNTPYMKALCEPQTVFLGDTVSAEIEIGGDALSLLMPEKLIVNE